LLGQIQAEIEGNSTSQKSSGANVHPPGAGAGAGAGSGSGTGSRAEQELIHKARETVEALTVQIQTSATAADESKLERLLGLCDQLNGGVDTLASRISRRSRLRGLGLKVDGLHGTGTATEAVVAAGANGETMAHEAEENVPLTPRVDKGKGRAEPEPEEPEKVLSPTFTITESEDEDEDDHRYVDVEEGDEIGVQATSPTDRFVRSCRASRAASMS
jgi:protein phosphatase 1 regulatory subunit 37